MKFLFWTIRLTKNKQEPTKEMEANRYYLNGYDCSEAENFIKACIELKEIDGKNNNSFYDTARQGLIAAAIVAYGRAFTTSDGGGNSANFVKINLGEATLNDQNKISLHRLIIRKRNKAVAHSDSEFRTSVKEVRSPHVVLRKSDIVDYAAEVNIHLFQELAHSMSEYFYLKGHEFDITNI